jgi:hypothetical protein
MTDSRRYYFRIPSINVYQCVAARSHTEAKALAADQWLPFWAELEWINIETITESAICH